MAKYEDAHVYYDTDSDPSNPGWVLMYSLAGRPVGGINLTEPLDAHDAEAAIAEAAIFLGTSRDEIRLKEVVQEDQEPPHQVGCICADCSGAELTSDND